MSNNNIIFARSSADRKPEYQLITTIRKDNNRLSVSKKIAQPEAREHLLSFNDKYELLANSGADMSISKITKLTEDEISFEFVEGNSLQSNFENCVKNNDLAGVKEIINQVFSKIDTFHTTKVNPTLDSNFVEIFGDTYNSSVECVYPACIDFNLDNLFVNKGDKLTLIDYEWVYDFPVPKDFIKLRVITGVFSELLRSIVAGFPDSIFAYYGNSLVIPVDFERAYGFHVKNVEMFIKTNAHFLNYLQNTITVIDPSPVQREVVVARELLKKIQPDLIEELHSLRYLNKRQARHIDKQLVVMKEQIHTIQSLQSQFAQLGNTLTHKLIGRLELRLRKIVGDHRTHKG